MVAKLQGEIWLSSDADSTLAVNQAKLLEAIDATGSISAAAKQLEISYKTAWERLERLNNLSASPLVTRSAGGSRGGGSQLTEHGKQVLKGFSEVIQEHSAFLEKLGTKLKNLDDLASFVKSSQLVSSARNQFLGEVTKVEPGAVNAEVHLKINDKVTLVAIVTEQSRLTLGIIEGSPLLALVKASSIMLTNHIDIAVSARNRITGVITRLERGMVNTDVTVDLGDGKTLNAVVTNYSAEQLQLAVSTRVCAFFKASSVILLGV